MFHLRLLPNRSGSAKHRPKMANVSGHGIGEAVTIGARVDSTLAADLARLAKSGDRTVSAEVRRALREHVDREGGRP